jgi:tyrosyl-DNA phosphodiesterase-1
MYDHVANLDYAGSVPSLRKSHLPSFQDFPVKTPDSPPSSPFESDLLDYLEALKWPGALVPSPDSAGEGTRVTASFFRRFDYSWAAVRLVASVPGYHSGRWLTKWGHMKMRAVLEKEAFADDFRRAPLVYQVRVLSAFCGHPVVRTRSACYADRACSITLFH